MKSPQTRINIIDGLKAVAMQVIVLHHLVSYGSLADAARTLAPDLVVWLYAHGRIAVQVFLVIGGYLAARALSPRGGLRNDGLAATLVNRYLRLALPYSVALLLAVACAVFARRWIDDDFISAAPTLAQWLAHVFLLQDLLGYESLSTGVWYVAIDFQLFALLALLSRLGLRICLPAMLTLTVASMFWFNRNGNLDDWALYFFGAYGLGAFAYWAGMGQRRAILSQRLLWLAAIAALLFDFRWRLLLALATAILLHFSHGGFMSRWKMPSTIAARGRISYALFLVHFPIYMLVSAMFVKHEWLMGPWSGSAGLATSWILSIVAAFLLHYWVETPANRLRISWVTQ